MTTGLNKALKEKLKNILISVFPQKADPLQMALKGNELEIAIKEHQPELLWNISVSEPNVFILPLQDPPPRLFRWVEMLEKDLPLESAVDNFLSELDQLLITKKLKVSITASLLGLRLQIGVDIQLEKNIWVKNFPEYKKIELKEKCTQHLQQSLMLGFQPRSELAEAFQEKIVSCVYGEFDVPFKFVNPNRQPSDATETRSSLLNIKSEFDNACELFLLSAHAVKNGFSEVFTTNFELKTINLLEHAGKNYFYQQNLRTAWNEMEINCEDAEKIKNIYIFLKTPSDWQNKIHLACRRLFLSESRVGSGGMFATTYADGLIDACIGLESVLLKPNDEFQTGRKIKENYCKIMSLSEKEGELEKKKIQDQILDKRDYVVHRRELSLSQKEIKCATELAQSMLRKLISAIVIDNAQLP